MLYEYFYMNMLPTDIPDVVILEPNVFGDDRGFFMETFNQQTLADLGIHINWVQDNHSRSGLEVLRGLHFQSQQAQDKLVRVTAGSVIDVAVDIRHGSPFFGQHVAVELSAANKRQLLVPKGFAHGFMVLSESADFLYKCSDFYAPQYDRGVRWDDPSIAISWPDVGIAPQLSGKDTQHPLLADMPVDDLPEYLGPYPWAISK